MSEGTEPWNHRVTELADRLYDMTWWEWQWVQKAVNHRFKQMESIRTPARDLAGRLPEKEWISGSKQTANQGGRANGTED